MAAGLGAGHRVEPGAVVQRPPAVPVVAALGQVEPAAQQIGTALRALDEYRAAQAGADSSVRSRAIAGDTDCGSSGPGVPGQRGLHVAGIAARRRPRRCRW